MLKRTSHQCSKDSRVQISYHVIQIHELFLGCCFLAMYARMLPAPSPLLLIFNLFFVVVIFVSQFQVFAMQLPWGKRASVQQKKSDN